MDSKTVTSGFSINTLGSKLSGNCRSLKMLLRVLILSNLFNVVWTCGPNEIGWRDGATGTISCGQCTSCPAGMEPTVGCGTTVDIGTVLECRVCVAGKTYSESDSVALCQACTVCSSAVPVLKQCTADSNTKCGSCPKGHYKDDFIEDCFKCSWCCEGDQDYVPECAQQGLPFKQSCKDLGNDCVGPTTRSSSNTTAQVPNNFTNARAHTGVTDVTLPTVKNQTTEELSLVFVLVVTLLIAAAGIVYLLVRKGRGRCPGWHSKFHYPTKVSQESSRDVTVVAQQSQQADSTSACLVIGTGSDIKKQDSGVMEVETRL